MSQHQPQQPYGYGPPPQQPKKSNAGKIVGFSCLGIVAAFVFLAVIGALLTGGDDTSGSSGGSDKPAAQEQPKDKPAEAHEKKPAAEDKKEAPAEEDEPEAKTDEAVFKVWGDGSADITYGSDSENLQGSGLPMTKTLKVKDDALYYHITAQLQGGGDIHCSVTIGGKTKEGHAQGGYNICSAQLNGDLFGGFS